MYAAWIGDIVGNNNESSNCFEQTKKTLLNLNRATQKYTCQNFPNQKSYSFVPLMHLNTETPLTSSPTAPPPPPLDCSHKK